MVARNLLKFGTPRSHLLFIVICVWTDRWVWRDRGKGAEFTDTEKLFKIELG